MIKTSKTSTAANAFFFCPSSAKELETISNASPPKHCCKRMAKSKKEDPKPTSSVSNDHSIVTAASNDTNVMLEHGTALTNSPVTSPIATGVGRMEVKNDASKIHESLQGKFEETLANKSEELIAIMKELSSSVQARGWESKEAGLYDKEGKLNWMVLIEMSERIFNEYSMSMEQITKEFDEFNKDFLIWQESAYIMDSEKVSKRLGSQENWIQQKEEYLKYKRTELSNSAKLIDETLKLLSGSNEND